MSDETLVLSATSLEVREGGEAGYTVSLSAEPPGEVTVAIAGAAGTDLTLDASTSLTFSTSNWEAAQTVTVSADEDADAVDDGVTLVHTAGGGRLRSGDAEPRRDGRRRLHAKRRTRGTAEA